MSQQVTPDNPRENARSQDGAAVGLENDPIDAELQAIIERWADLPKAMKTGIMAMVRATGG